MKKWLRILKLRVIDWIGFKLTSNERSEICYWITRNVTKSNEETLSEVNGEVDEFGGKFIYCPYIPSIITPTLKEMDDYEKGGG